MNQSGHPLQEHRVLQWGVPWGLAVTLAEALVITRGSHLAEPASAAAWLLGWYVPAWCATGCLFVACLVPAESRYGTRGLVLAWLVVSIVAAGLFVAVSSAAWQLLDWITTTQGSWRASADLWLARPGVREALFAYYAWINLFFGGLLACALRLDLRVERTRSLLHTATVGRMRAAALAGEVELESLRAQVDPAMMVATLAEIRACYLRDAAAAERLLDSLVAFLRAATTGLRQRRSTLGAELALAEARTRLQAERGLPRAWRVSGGGTGLNEVPFPACLVLPVLALGDGSGNATLEVVPGGDERHLQLVARGLAELPAGLGELLRAQLRPLHPDAVVRQGRGNGGITLTIDNLSRPATGEIRP